MRFGVVCRYLNWELDVSYVLAFSWHEVVCDLGEARSCATLKDQSIHVGNSLGKNCVECVHGVSSRGVRLVGLNMMSSAKLNLVNFVVRN